MTSTSPFSSFFMSRATVTTTRADGGILLVCIDRPAQRNAVDRPTAAALVAAFERFDADPTLLVAVLHGAGGTVCASETLTHSTKIIILSR
jgi:enoyl-CoA hydratase/carnithine racemase